MPIERLPVGKDERYYERKPARNGAIFHAKEYSPLTGTTVRTVVRILDQDTVSYQTPLGSIILRENQINGVLPRLQFFPKLGRRRFELTWKPSK